jgi:cell division protein FtsB
MPRTYTTTTTAYQFSELSDVAKQRVIDKFYDINIDYEWWEFTYEDAKEVGLKITGFDLDRGSYCKMENINYCLSTTAELIMANHGPTCETYQTSKAFLEAYKPKKERLTQVEDILETWYENDEGTTEEEQTKWDELNQEESELSEEIEELKDEFLKDLSNDYLTMLRDEYEYMTSKDAIIETIEVNEYEFDEDGNQL